MGVNGNSKKSINGKIVLIRETSCFCEDGDPLIANWLLTFVSSGFAQISKLLARFFCYRILDCTHFCTHFVQYSLLTSYSLCTRFILALYSLCTHNCKIRVHQLVRKSLFNNCNNMTSSRYIKIDATSKLPAVEAVTKVDTHSRDGLLQHKGMRIMWTKGAYAIHKWEMSKQ